MKRLIALLLLGLAVGTGYGFGRQTQPTAKINPQLAWFRIEGARLTQTATKRLTLITLEYNGSKVPCVLVDTQAGPLSNETAGGAAISCGWSESAVSEITGE